MGYEFKSVFADEMNNYLSLLRKSERYIDKIQSTLRSLDRYLAANNFVYKVLEADTISLWQKTRNVSARTKADGIYNLKGFVKYLLSFGIKASCPEISKYNREYVPYVFSDIEIKRIISAADNFEAWKRFTQTNLLFPILLRVLYGCGLRLGEGRSLRWSDVNLETGLIVVREAKNLKQRFVPMDDSLICILRDYKRMTEFGGICGEYLFESDLYPGRPFKNNTFYEWFSRVLQSAGISYTKYNNRERGPCPHCLRHCFTLKSFLKSENEGRRFEDTAPFLAAYLGHDSVRETEAYLSSGHNIYAQSHQRVNNAIGHLFPEVNFDEN